ncbi:hypothetical protein [Ralstonia sp. SET104]|uniref:hypothetical protein n=1 Tax=Ralstonia sp. SET104 TaxID=2448774 RepID=UPI0035B5573B
MLEDDTCHFLAVDFDEAEWREDSRVSPNPHALSIDTNALWLWASRAIFSISWISIV